MGTATCDILIIDAVSVLVLHSTRARRIPIVVCSLLVIIYKVVIGESECGCLEITLLTVRVDLLLSTARAIEIRTIDRAIVNELSRVLLLLLTIIPITLLVVVVVVSTSIILDTADMLLRVTDLELGRRQ